MADATTLPASAAANYWRFARAGGDLVLVGGRPPRLNTTRSDIGLNLMSPYEPLVMHHDAAALRATPYAAALSAAPPRATAAPAPACPCAV